MSVLKSQGMRLSSTRVHRVHPPPPLPRDIRKTSEDALQDLQGVTSLRVAHIVKRIITEDLAKKSEAVLRGGKPLHKHLWTRRDVPSIDSFLSAFDALGDERRLFPLLESFFRVESRLALIQELVPVLAWHGIIFEVSGEGGGSCRRL